MAQFIALGSEVFLVIWIGLDLYRHRFHNLKTVADEPGALLRIIADQA